MERPAAGGHALAAPEAAAATVANNAGRRSWDESLASRVLLDSRTGPAL
ncbi:hypothetical protein ACFQ0G_03920 [Streptomyces chiangmaiensis]